MRILAVDSDASQRSLNLSQLQFQKQFWELCRTCSRSHVVISFIQPCISQRGDSYHILACEGLTKINEVDEIKHEIYCLFTIFKGAYVKKRWEVCTLCFVQFVIEIIDQVGFPITITVKRIF